MTVDEERLLKKMYDEMSSLHQEIHSVKQDVQKLSNKEILAEIISLRDENKSLKQDITNLSGMLRTLVKDKIDAATDAVQKETEDQDAYIELNEADREIFGPCASRALSALHFAGIYTYRDFLYVSRKEISRMRDVGKGTLKVIEYIAHTHHTALTDNPEAINLRVGDPVILRITPRGSQGNRVKVKKGDVLTISRIIPSKECHYCFRAPQYVCLDHEDNEIYLSPGQLKSI